MPNSPISPVAITISAAPWKISSSALTMSQRMVLIQFLALLVRIPRESADGLAPSADAGLASGSLGGHGLCFFEHFVDPANHVEGLFRQMVALAIDDHLEATDGFLKRHVFAG